MKGTDELRMWIVEKCTKPILRKPGILNEPVLDSIDTNLAENPELDEVTVYFVLASA